MAANQFNKEERVQFEVLLEGFEDALIMSEHVSRFSTDQQSMERSRDIIWRPQPYIAQTFPGTDQTNNFRAQTQLSVPASINIERSSPWILTATELRDQLQEGRLGKAATQRLASDINVAILTAAINKGSIVVTKSSAASGFADVAAIESAMNRVGINFGDRNLALSTFDYNGLATDLANRQNMVDMSKKAYQNGYVGMVAAFDTWKLDYSLRLTAAAGGGSLTMDTRASAAQYYVPKATRTATTGEVSNVDNRYQQVIWSSTANVAEGDCFTLATVNEVHHITKLDTGNLKTFRVVSVDDSTHVTITPPIISNQGGSDAEAQYQNCVVNTPASNTAIVFLNTVTKNANPFWHRDAIELLPGRYAVPSDAGTAVMRATTKNGIEVVMQKWYDIKTMNTLYRMDIRFGVNVCQPEMCGIALFSQT